MENDEVIAATVPKPPFRWSFSQYETYSQCPAKWKFANVLKLPRGPSGPAAARGSNMHDRVEAYIKNESTTLEPPEGLMFGDKKPAKIAARYIPIIEEIKTHPNGDRYCEKRLTFDSDWDITYDKTTTACTAILDAATYLKPRATSEGFLKIYEWKSGKPKDTHSDQRKLYALCGMRHWGADVVEVTTYYLEDTAEPQRLVLKGETGYEKLRQLWDERAALMSRDMICAPKPSFGCRWCDYAKDKGGPCIFG